MEGKPHAKANINILRYMYLQGTWGARYILPLYRYTCIRYLGSMQFGEVHVEYIICLTITPIPYTHVYDSSGSLQVIL